MSEDISTKITPSLHPDNVRAIDGYDDDTKVFLGPTEEVFTAAYTAIQAVWETREIVERDTTRTEDSKVLQIDAFANKHLDRLTRQFDTVLGNLDKSIASIERELTAPVESRSGNAIASEIRSFVRGLKTDARLGFMQRAIEQGDEVSLSAVCGAPAYLSDLTEDLKQSYIKLWREKNAPDVAKRLRAMKGAKQMIEERGGMVFTELAKAVNVPHHKVKRLREAQTAAEKALIMSEK